jgi:hypothetical protein
MGFGTGPDTDALARWLDAHDVARHIERLTLHKLTALTAGSQKASVVARCGADVVIASRPSRSVPGSRCIHPSIGASSQAARPRQTIAPGEDCRMQWENRRIIVTGGARGIGAATVRAYLAEGARVVVLDVLEDEGRAVVAQANVAGLPAEGNSRSQPGPQIVPLVPPSQASTRIPIREEALHR